MKEQNNLPQHVAIIMDGNGRWAEQRRLPRLAGHNAGMNSMIEITRVASDLGIKYLTVYAFSTENWKRSEEEVSGIFKLLVKYVELELRELHKNNVRVRVLGDYTVIPTPAKERLEETIATTEENTGLQLNIALNYGSHMEIVRAFRLLINSLIDEGVSGDMLCDSITQENISSYMYTGRENGDIPDPDLIIRTSGEKRLSNFMLWQSAYSELAFTKVLWPDFNKDIFLEIIQEYGSRNRRFGGRK